MGREKTMTYAEAVDLLSKLCRGKDWFYDIGQDQYGRPVVYINYSCEETLHDIPDLVGGHQVLVHFAASLCTDKSKYVDNGTTTRGVTEDNIPVPLTRQIIDVTDHAELIEEEDKSLRHLTDQLDKLEKQCGSNILQDIFYEVHDGRNAVTNLGAKFPEVRSAMEKLYKTYGFDIIYDEMDG